MKTFKRALCLVSALCFSLVLVLEARADSLSLYGFNTPSSGYDYLLYTDAQPVINVYAESGALIGKVTNVVARLRMKELASANEYYDMMLVRSQMEPMVTRKNGEYYRGLNNMNRLQMTLNPGQNYVNMAPMATMPESSSTWDISFGVTGNNKKEFGFSIGTGYSSTTKNNCVEVSSNFTSANKKYDVRYDYSVSAHIFSTAARKASNKWCSNTHQCYYAFTYRTPKNNTKDMVLNYNVNFRYAKTPYAGVWDGSTRDVIAFPSSGRSDSLIVSYNYSN